MPVNNIEALINQEVQAEVNSSKVTTKLQSIDHLVAGDTAVLQISKGGLTYNHVIIKLGGSLTPGKMLNCFLKVGTKVIGHWKTGAEIASLNNFYNNPDQSGFLTLDFARIELNQLSQRERFSVSTYTDDLGNRINAFTFEFDVAAGLSNPQATAWAVQSRAQVGVGREIVKVRRFASENFVAGENEITSIPAIAKIKAVHFLTNRISKIQVVTDTVTIFDSEKEIIEVLQKRAKYPRVPQAGWTSVDWCLGGTPNSAIIVTGVNDLRFKVTTTHEVVADIIVEYIDRINGLV